MSHDVRHAHELLRRVALPRQQGLIVEKRLQVGSCGMRESRVVVTDERLADVCRGDQTRSRLGEG